MAFSRRVLSRVPAFDVELGPGALGLGEDSLFALQLREAGYVIVGAPDTVVEHHCDASRLLRVNWLHRARHSGWSAAYRDYHWHHKDIQHAWLKYAAAVATLRAWRVKWRKECRREEGCVEREMVLARTVHYFERFMIERRRPRNYTVRGLVKQAL
jgi:GT2 family glycosyltransferase